MQNKSPSGFKVERISFQLGVINCFVEMEYPIYANAHRGKMSKVGVSPSHPPIIEDETPFVPSRGWAEVIKKVYQIDPLICPQCGGRMRIISFIEDHKVIDKIIAYLKLTFHAERPRLPLRSSRRSC